MQFGASGFIAKTLGVDKIRAAIAQVLSGEVWIPPGVEVERDADAEMAHLISRLATSPPSRFAC